MISAVDDRTLFLALLALLAVAIVTVEFCRRDKAEFASAEDFLFSGKKQIHALASNVGALFSLTYFFGASFIYGMVFGWLFFACACVILAILILSLPQILAKIHRRLEPPTDLRSNLLLDYLSTTLNRKNFRSVVRLYLLIYFALLVEELAVSRLVFTAVFPWNPLVASLILSTIVLVIYSYLILGGFRAVLLSDLVQMVVVTAFLICLLGLIWWGSSPPPSSGVFPDPEPASWVSFPFLVLFGVSWFMAGVDFYSRLNFRSESKLSPLRQRNRLARWSLVAIFAVLFVGILYGIRLRQIIPELISPTQYTFETVEHFLAMRRPVVVIGFLASIMCMVFTTIDTLMLTLLQLGQYQNENRPRVQRSNLALVVLGAVVLSTFLSFDATSAFGIFAGSLMILPLCVVVSQFSTTVGRLLPARHETYEFAVIVAFMVFAYFYEDLRSEFGSHFLIPGLVFLSTLGTCLFAIIIQFIQERRGAK